jgi:hypothetical protein
MAAYAIVRSDPHLALIIGFSLEKRVRAGAVDIPDSQKEAPFRGLGRNRASRLRQWLFGRASRAAAGSEPSRLAHFGRLPEELKAKIWAEVLGGPNGRADAAAGLLVSRGNSDTIREQISIRERALERVTEIEDRKAARDYVTQFVGQSDLFRYLVDHAPSPVRERLDALKRWPHIDHPIEAARQDLLHGIGTASSLRAAHAIKDEAAYDQMVVNTYSEIQQYRRIDVWHRGHWRFTEETDLQRRFDVPAIHKLERDAATHCRPIEEILNIESRGEARKAILDFCDASKAHEDLVMSAPPSTLARIRALDNLPRFDDRFEAAAHEVRYAFGVPASTISFLYGIKDKDAFNRMVSETAASHVQRRNAADFDDGDPVGLMNDDEIRTHYDGHHADRSALAWFRPGADAENLRRAESILSAAARPRPELRDRGRSSSVR